MATEKNPQDTDKGAEAAERTAAGADALRADVETLRNDMAAVTKSLADLARSQADGARDAAWAQAEHVRDEVGNMVGGLGNQGRRQVDWVEHEVASRPLLSLLAAFGVGVLVGKLLDRD